MILPVVEAVGIYNSQIERPNVIKSKKRKTSMFEIDFPIENGGISFIDTELSMITDDIIICAKPNQKRNTKFPFKCHYIHMTVSDEVLCDMLMGLPSFLKIKNRQIYEEIFEQLNGCYALRNSQEDILLQSLVLKLIYTLLNEVKSGNSSGRTGTGELHIHRALKFIKENITEELTLERVAREVSLSPVYFHNSFKSAIGKTLREYVEEMRIKKAIEYLISTDMTLTEVAYSCGFSSQSYFSYVFKRKMNATPREYVRKLNLRYEI